MSLIVIILLVVALVLFVIATIGVPSPPRFNLLAAGLAFCVLAMLAGHVKAQTPQQNAQRAYERDQRSRGNDYELRNQKDYDAIEHKRRGWEHKQWCREWRARVDRHPRLILPRSCWR